VKGFEIGGVVAAAGLIAFGIATIIMGFNGRSTVRDSLKQEQIVGTRPTPCLRVRSSTGRPRKNRHEGRAESKPSRALDLHRHTQEVVGV